MSVVELVASELQHLRNLDLLLVKNEDVFLREFRNIVDAHQIVFRTIVDSEYFSDDVREALGHSRVCTSKKKYINVTTLVMYL